MAKRIKQQLYKENDRIVTRGVTGMVLCHLDEQTDDGEHVYHVQMDDGGAGTARESDLKPHDYAP